MLALASRSEVRVSGGYLGYVAIAALMTLLVGSAQQLRWLLAKRVLAHLVLLCH
jgi:hypothetical protein